MKDKMKALTVVSPNNLQYIDVPVPEIEDNQLLIKVKRAGICATDFSIYTGESSFVKSGQIKYPIRFGHEWSGEVVRVGKSVSKFKPGDRVYSDNGISCGKCEACKRGDYAACPNIRSVGTVNCWDGCFAEYMVIPEYHVYPIPDSVSYDEAAMIEPASIAYDAFIGTNLNKDSVVAVVGTGAIGMAAVWLAKFFGAGKVIMIGRQDQKLEISKKLGADLVINNTKTDSIKSINEITASKGADLIIETSGSEKALKDAMSSVCKYGRISIVSFYERNLNDMPIDRMVLNCVSIVGAAGRFGNPAAVCEIMMQNPVKLTAAISHYVDFDECTDAFVNEEKYHKEKIKVIVKFDD